MEVRTRFQTIDIVLCSFLFAPIIVLFWHGFFGVLDDIMLKEYPYFGAWTIFILGIGIQVLSSCLQDTFRASAEEIPSEYHRVLILVNNFTLGAAQILQFRGVNDLYDAHVGAGVSDAISATITAAVLLCALGLCSHTLDVPFVLGLDTSNSLQSTFSYASYHDTAPGLSRDHLIDALSTVGVLQTCVHLFAVASWVAVDSGLFKNIPLLAILASWFGGFSIYIVFWLFTALLQSMSRKLAAPDSRRFVAKIVTDFLLIGQGLGVVMMWHGHWVLYDVIAYWLPISFFGKNLTPYFEVLMAAILLIVCQITTNLVRSGLPPDDVLTSVDAIGINVAYFTYFYEEDILKAEASQKATASNNNNAIDEKDGRGASGKENNSTKDREFRAKKPVSLQDLINADRQRQKSNKSQ